MKKILLIFLLVATLSSANAQKNDCKNFKTGKFKITANGSTVIIDRTKETQTETVDDGTKIILKIKNLKLLIFIYLNDMIFLY